MKKHLLVSGLFLTLSASFILMVLNPGYTLQPSRKLRKPHTYIKETCTYIHTPMCICVCIYIHNTDNTYTCVHIPAYKCIHTNIMMPGLYP